MNSHSLSMKKRPAAGLSKNVFTRSACGNLSYISHRQENV